MRPCKLTMQAFGPFAERERVDFSALPADSLFLIHGPTGAGKTTIMDGICYALYGSTSGNERQAREMRSHHAQDTVQTEVELEFELGGQLYLIKRIPEQERAAQRGKKDKVKVSAKAELYRHDGNDWMPIASKSSEVTETVERLLGFEADQFRQVVMLPQGQFRRLLSADTREREKIMEALFSTEKYRRLQDRLQESARALERRAEEERSKRQMLLEQAGAESEEGLAIRVQEIEQTLASLQPQLEQTRSAADAAAKTLADAEALAGKFREAEQARAVVRRLQENDEAMLAESARLELAHRAQLVEPAWCVVAAAAAQLKEQRQKADAAAAQADQTDAAHRSAEAKLVEETGKESVREAARREIALLESLGEAVGRLEQAQTAREHAFKRRIAADTLLEKHTRHVQNLADRRQSLHATVERLMPLAAGIDAARHEAEKLERLLQTVEKLTAVDQGLVKANAAVVAAAQKLETAQNRVAVARARREDLDEAWRNGQAAVLARHLADGTACPVCGSHDHPHPAIQDDHIPSNNALKEAAAEVLAAEAAFDAMRTAFSHAESEKKDRLAMLNALRETLTGHDWEAYVTPSLRHARLSEAQARLQQATEAAQELGPARAQLQECETAIADSEAALVAARASAMDANNAFAAADAALSTLSGSVPDNLRTNAALEAALSKARVALNTLDQAHKAAQRSAEEASSAKAAAAALRESERAALAAAEKRLAEARIYFEEILAKSGFADAASFKAARLEQEERERIDRLVREHEQAKAKASERLALAEEAIAGAQTPDMDALQAALHAVQAERDSLTALQGAQAQQLEDVRRTTGMLAEIRARLDAIEKEYSVLGELATVAAGKNGANMAFQRYVLAALLDDVLRQASLRLKTMSRNRYALQRSGGVTDGRRAAGLDLEVLDDYTGRTRPAGTLSGGEGFMASLALALGLSDTVQAYAGGIKLDTLFIDEGFGTLDPESLDLAMKTLAELQQKGRMVGVISHVEELKRQIDNAIEVRFGASGSTVKVISAAH